jgi:class 3 adenylate cyclase/DNA-binding beta-propeller fold protein YncE
MSRRAQGRNLAALLFTDIVGSTEIAVELGDRRWRAIQAEHHSLIRRELRRFGGREIDTAGDSFFATFHIPQDAVRSAAAIVEATRSIGIEVRAGLHFGETELSSGGAGGIAVHTAARVSSLAAPGEVLVTQTIVDLVSGSGLDFDERGTHELKGVPGAWRLFALLAVDGVALGPTLDPLEAAERRTVASSDRPEGRTRARAFLVGGIASVIAITVAAFAIANRASSDRPSTPPSGQTSQANGYATLFKVNPTTTVDQVQAVYLPRISAGPIVSAGGSIWALTESNNAFQSGGVFEINPGYAEPQVAKEIPLPGACLSPATCMAASGNAVWVSVLLSEGLGIQRIDATTGRPAKRPTIVDPSIKRPGGEVMSFNAPVTWGVGSVWLANGSSGTIYRIDPSTGRPIDTIRLGAGVTVDLLAYGEGSVWAVDRFGGTLTAINPATDRAEPPIPLQGDPTSIAVGAGSVWVTEDQNDQLLRIDPHHPSGIQTVGVGHGPVAVAIGGGSIWVANQGDGTVSEVNPRANLLIQTIPVSAAVQSLVFADGALWVGSFAPPGV